MTTTRALAALILVLSLAVLGVALAAERYGGLVPCALCLVERWPYRIAAAFALAALLLPGRAGWWVLWGAALCMAAGVVAGGVHIGVEHGWWPSPLPECAAPRFSGGSIAQRLASMPLTVAKPCDAPVFPIPGLPVSMAAMNLLAALVIGGGLALSLLRQPRALR